MFRVLSNCLDQQLMSRGGKSRPSAVGRMVERVGSVHATAKVLHGIGQSVSRAPASAG